MIAGNKSNFEFLFQKKKNNLTWRIYQKRYTVSKKKSQSILRAKQATFTIRLDKILFIKPETCDQTMLPDKSLLIGQTLVWKAKIQKFRCDILSYFQILCKPRILHMNGFNFQVIHILMHQVVKRLMSRGSKCATAKPSVWL